MNETEQQYRNEVDYDEDTISISEILFSLLRYWKIIALIVFSIAALLFFSAIAYYAAYPRRTTVSMRFLLTFDGAEDGEYPNQAPFSASGDILATNILRDVYDKNNISDYIPFNDFVDSLAVTQNIPAIDRLEREHAARMADDNLSSTQVERFIREFEARKESLYRPEYRISFSYTDRLSAPPAEMIEKVLHDILNHWADYAADKKGALKYRISLYSPQLLESDLLRQAEPIVALDTLRRYSNRILDSIEKIEKIPGVETVRAESENASLRVVKELVEDTVQYDIKPLYSLMISQGMIQNVTYVKHYFENRLNTMLQDKSMSEQRDDIFRQAYKLYTGESFDRQPEKQERLAGDVDTSSPLFIAQFDGRFFNRVFDALTKEEDFKYRQEKIDELLEHALDSVDVQENFMFYKNLHEQIQSLDDNGYEASGIDSRMENMISAKFESIKPKMVDSLRMLSQIYEHISEHNLNPRTLLYEKTSPMSISSSFPARRVLMILIALFTISVLITLYGALLHANFSKGKSK